jgi:hypothetical protein
MLQYNIPKIEACVLMYHHGRVSVCLLPNNIWICWLIFIKLGTNLIRLEIAPPQ